jgi:hypothetical protein
MFTDFVTECRAHKAHVRGDTFEAAKKSASSPERIVEPIAVAA